MSHNFLWEKTSYSLVVNHVIMQIVILMWSWVLLSSTYYMSLGPFSSTLCSRKFHFEVHWMRDSNFLLCILQMCFAHGNFRVIIKSWLTLSCYWYFFDMILDITVTQNSQLIPFVLFHFTSKLELPDDEVCAVPVAIYVVLREQFDRSCSWPLISKCQHEPIQFAFQCMRESSQKKVIKVCVDDYLVRWHENQKNLDCFECEFIIVHQAKCCESMFCECIFKVYFSWNLGCWRIINSLVGDSRIVCVVREFLIQQQGYEVLTLNENPKQYKCRDCSRCMFERLQWAEYYRFIWFRTVLGICLASIVMRFRVQGLGSRAWWGGGLQNGSCGEIL
jgi:hypothetical protein